MTKGDVHAPKPWTHLLMARWPWVAWCGHRAFISDVGEGSGLRRDPGLWLYHTLGDTSGVSVLMCKMRLLLEFLVVTWFSNSVWASTKLAGVRSVRSLSGNSIVPEPLQTAGEALAKWCHCRHGGHNCGAGAATGVIWSPPCPEMMALFFLPSDAHRPASWESVG